MRRGKRLISFLVIGVAALFIFIVSFSGSAKAIEQSEQQNSIIINEVMANAPGNDSTDGKNLEWIELYNASTGPINLKDWKVDIYNSSGTITKEFSFTNNLFLGPDKYLLIVKNLADFNAHWTVDPNQTTTFVEAFVLVNSLGKVVLTSPDASQIYEFAWTETSDDGISMEVIGPPYDPTYIEWHESLNADGTPGSKNSVSLLAPPEKPVLSLPATGQIFNGKQTIELEWQLTISENMTRLEYGSDSVFSDPNIIEIEENGRVAALEDLDLGKYYWRIVSYNELYETVSEVFNFEIKEPVYSDAIIVSELNPNPVEGNSEEWIELFNNSGELVDLKGWNIEDLSGSTHKYIIDENLVINAYGYIVLTRSQTSITLNNDADGLALFQPNNKLLYKTPIFSDGQEGWVFARAPGGKWEWTMTATPGAKNTITAYIEDAGGENDENISPDEGVPKNTVPIKILTGEYQNYEDYLVVVSGTVVETSGDTFYLDDGSGKAKIYIQEKTGIDKPEMHKGDVFQVTGLVDLYRNTWRILPRNASEIILVSKKATTTKTFEICLSTTPRIMV